MDDDGELQGDELGGMPPIPAGGVEARVFGADQVAPKPVAVELAEPESANPPTVRRVWSEAALKNKKLAVRSGSAKVQKRAKPKHTQGFFRRTGPRNSAGKRTFAYSDPVHLLILAVLSVPVIYAAIAVYLQAL